MNICDKLAKEGWHITEEGVESLTENNSILNTNAVIQKALNIDLKEIGRPVLQSCNNNLTQVVLQVQKLRNISAPKSNQDSQAAPRMLKFILTDGNTHIQAIEVGSNPSINLNNIPPGTKIKIKTGLIKNGFLLLDTNSITVLGGKVNALYEKWELSKSLATTQRNAGKDGAPKWVNFGYQIAPLESNISKSLDKSTEKQNIEFELVRKNAIAEANKSTEKKIFGGGTKQMLQQQESKKFQSNFGDKSNYQERQKRGKREQKEPIEKPQKAPEKASLFDFLETKLSLSETPKVFSENNSNNAVYNHKYLSNQSDNSKMNGSIINQEQRPKFKPNIQHFDNKTKYNNVDNNYSNNSNYIQKSNNDYRNKPEYSNNYRGKKYDFNNSYQSPSNSNYNKPYHNSNQSTYQTTTNNEAKSYASSNNSTSIVQTKQSVDTVVANMQKLSLNSAFATRSLKQHLNLDKTPRETVESNSSWNIGDQCMAKYWEDNKSYKATITAVTNRTCVVQFNDYGNYEEVLKQDCLPVEGASSYKKTGTRTFGNKNYFNKQKTPRN